MFRQAVVFNKCSKGLNITFQRAHHVHLEENRLSLELQRDLAGL